MKKAFTLIEILVAVSIFIVVITVALTLFVSGINGQRKVIALQDVQDNAKFLMGFIIKEVRMSKINYISPSILNITRPNGESVIYTFNNSEGTIERVDSSTNGQINSNDVLVYGNFYGLGIGSNDNQQVRVTIVMDVQKNIGKTDASIKIQTTVSQRNLDL